MTIPDPRRRRQSNIAHPRRLWAAVGAQPGEPPVRQTGGSRYCFQVVKDPAGARRGRAAEAVATAAKRYSVWVVTCHQRVDHRREPFRAGSRSLIYSLLNSSPCCD